MGNGGFSAARLERLSNVLTAHVEGGALPGLVTLISRRGETHVNAIGAMTFGGAPMQRNTLFRIASMTKPIAAAAAMMLVEDGTLRLDDPVDKFLPELANRKVLKTLDSTLDDTVPARRAITLRDLLTLRLGFGVLMARPGQYPIQKAMEDAGLMPGFNPPTQTPDVWMKALGALPLMFQPGERFLYHTGLDVLGVLIARASGQSLETFLRARLFEPLGMKDTGFYVSADQSLRLPPTYKSQPGSNMPVISDDSATTHRWTSPPAFPSAGGGLLSTVDDYLAFCRMMLNHGRASENGPRLLARPTVQLMITDQLTAQQRADAEIFFGVSAGWGFGMAVCIARDNLFTTPGRFGWDGGAGTSAHSDPAEDLVGVLMTQRVMDAPTPPAVFTDFWNGVYQAVDD